MTVSRLTEGLLTSMIMRLDHSLFFPAACPAPEDERNGRLREHAETCVAAHDAAQAGHPVLPILLEEMTGRGFYSERAEEWYRNLMEKTPGAAGVLRSVLEHGKRRGGDACALG